MFKRYTRERDNILILRKFKQHVPHLVRTLYNVGQTIERRIVQDVSYHVRVDYSAILVVHERPCVYRCQALYRATKVVRSQVRSVGKLDVDQAVNRRRRVRSDLDQGVESES